MRRWDYAPRNEAKEKNVPLFDAGARRGAPAVVSNRVWTAPNIITFIRLLGLPLFVWVALDGAYGKAFGILAVVGWSDYLDGYLARRFNQITRLGQMMDPLIDRILLATTALTLLVIGFLPVWVAILVLGRDLLLLVGGLVLTRGVPKVTVTYTGKFATANLLAGIPGFFLGYMSWPLAGPFRVATWCFTLVGIVSYYVAGIDYARKLLRERAAR